jgi:hypothetical protein
MIFHYEELALARAYEQAHPFEGLTDEQMSAVMAKGRTLYHWFKEHPAIHNTINLTVLIVLFAADYFILLELPGVFLPAGEAHSWGAILAAAAVSGSLHSYLLYSLGVLSLHEGAAHRIVFVGKGRFARVGHTIVSNLCRLSGGEPDYYSTRHMAHHSKFGTEHDEEFLNFVFPRRYFLTFLPLAAIVNFTDFIIHRPPTYTRGRIVSALFAWGYNIPYIFLVSQKYGWAVAALMLFIFLPHVGFYVDRLRQFTEHNLMPLDNRNGARSFGIGFWGLFVGGGPWGQPCHWVHHLVPSIPWYQQIVLHRHVVKMLTPRQREQFLLKPIVGFPLLWWRLVRELSLFSGSAAANRH